MNNKEENKIQTEELESSLPEINTVETYTTIEDSHKSKYKHNFTHSDLCSTDNCRLLDHLRSHFGRKKDLSSAEIRIKIEIYLICPYCKFLETSKDNIYNLDTSIPIKILEEVLFDTKCNFHDLHYSAHFDFSEELDLYIPKILHTAEQLEGLKTITKPLLVVDLDNCLLQGGDCYKEYSYHNDKDCDLSMVFERWGTKKGVHVTFRPYLEYFLKTVSEEFDLVVFTNGVKGYANTVSDYLKKFVGIKAVLYREDCSYYDGSYIKDLRLFGDIKDIFMLDNDAMMAKLQPEKFIYIHSWYLFEDENRSDNELFKVANFLVRMAKRGVKDLTKSLRVKELLELPIKR